MNNNDTTTELLLQYLDNELDEATKTTVEKRLANEQDLRDQFYQLQLAREGVRLFGLRQQVKQIASEFNSVHTSHVITKPAKVRTIGKWSVRVAAILILVIAGIGVYEYTTISSNNLYAQLYQPYETRASRGNEELGQVESAYNKKQYAASIAAFQSEREHSTADYFYVGQAFLETNNLNEAIHNLENSLQSAKISHQYIQESEFYLALAYLKANNINDAKPLFEKIHDDPNHLFHDKVSSWFLKKLYFLGKKSKN